jgi:hypothetical protein
MFDHFSWYWFAAMMATYTFMAFTCAGFRSAMIFSKRNTIPAVRVWSEHFKFLTILFVLMWIISAVYPDLPAWMKVTWMAGRGSKSTVDLAFIAAILVLNFLEHRRIYAEAEPEGDESQ